jgi:simple sugar transport system ATP-binding protein
MDQVRAGAIVEVENVTKRYGAVRALTGVTLTFRPGLSAIVGDNGAGKTTLMQILAGVHSQDQGSIRVGGKECTFRSPAEAREAGIEALYQDLALADTLSISANVFLGREIVSTRARLVRTLDHKAMARAADEVISSIGIRMPAARTVVRELSGGQRQAVALARALHFNASVVLLDEPTAALGPREAAAFIDVIAGVVRLGKTVVMIAHNLPQVMQLASHIAVMRAGAVVGEFSPDETDVEELNAFIVGARVKTAPGTGE